MFDYCQLLRLHAFSRMLLNRMIDLYFCILIFFNATVQKKNVPNCVCVHEFYFCECLNIWKNQQSAFYGVTNFNLLSESLNEKNKISNNILFKIQSVKFSSDQKKMYCGQIKNHSISKNVHYWFLWPKKRKKK